LGNWQKSRGGSVYSAEKHGLTLPKGAIMLGNIVVYADPRIDQIAAKFRF
jgi:hypothetical protein